jgi:hypothetical protein
MLYLQEPLPYLQEPLPLKIGANMIVIALRVTFTIMLIPTPARLSLAMQALIAERSKCQEASSRTMFQKLDFIASRLTSMPKGNRLPVSYGPILQ